MNATAEVKADESEVLAGGGTTNITLSTGVTVDIYKCKVKHFAFMVNLLRSVMARMDITDVGKMEEQADKLESIESLMDFIMECSTDLFHLMSLLTSLSTEDVEELEFEDAYAVILSVWGLNKDFFLNKVLPVVKGGR